jgi:hypothetical protein
MKECKSGECGIGEGKSYGYDDRGDCSCGCGSDCSCGCGGESCECTCCNHEGSKAKEFMMLAKKAHMELLKDKMKAVMEAKVGKKMDRVAELVVETALVYMKDRMAEKQAHENFEEKLMEIFKS